GTRLTLEIDARWRKGSLANVKGHLAGRILTEVGDLRDRRRAGQRSPDTPRLKSGSGPMTVLGVTFCPVLRDFSRVRPRRVGSTLEAGSVGPRYKVLEPC